MTGQDLLDRMELIRQELQLQPGEADVSRALIALNVAQDYFETFAAGYPTILGSTVGTLTTTASSESTDFPSGVLRIDRLQYIDPATSLPAWDLSPIRRIGGHRRSFSWFIDLISVSGGSGKPRSYTTYGSKIFWAPLPDDTHTIRWYGFQRAADITAAGTFAYDDAVSLPVAAFATKILSVGVDDDPMALDQIASQSFLPTLEALAATVRDGAVPLQYTEVHS